MIPVILQYAKNLSNERVNAVFRNAEPRYDYTRLPVSYLPTVLSLYSYFILDCPLYEYLPVFNLLNCDNM